MLKGMLCDPSDGVTNKMEGVVNRALTRFHVIQKVRIRCCTKSDDIFLTQFKSRLNSNLE